MKPQFCTWKHKINIGHNRNIKYYKGEESKGERMF